MMEPEEVGGWLCVACVLAIIAFGTHSCVAAKAWHESKWHERCRHMQCDHGLADWSKINGTDACVCVTTAKRSP